MNEKHNLYLLDEQEESFLQSLFDDAMEQEGQAAFDAQAAGTEELPQVPEALDQKCREIIHSAGKTHKRRAARTCICSAVKRIAVFIAVILPIASVLVMSVDAVKVPVLNYIMKSNEHYSSIGFGRQPNPINAEPSIVTDIVSIQPPDGYQLKHNETAHDGMIMIHYINQSGDYIRISLTHTDSILNIDTEDVEIIPTDINGHEAFYLNKRDLRVIWFDEDKSITFDIRANALSEDEFWKYIFRLSAK